MTSLHVYAVKMRIFLENKSALQVTQNHTIKRHAGASFSVDLHASNGNVFTTITHRPASVRV